jgi:uncharacterized protein YlzI (FlbEa/FlbD family)
VNTDGFYDPLIEMLEKLNKLKFLHGKQYVVVEEAKDVVKALYEQFDSELSSEELEFKEKNLKQ